MTFLENIFERLQQAGPAPVLREIRHGKIKSVSGDELLAMVQEARSFLISRGMKKGDRCALLASNSIRWVALDLAMMAEEIIVVPLYSRQAPCGAGCHDERFIARANLLLHRCAFRGNQESLGSRAAHYAAR